jgi:hypothetical protein
MIKEVLLDTNPYLLGTTVIVSIFHMVFEMLAFKSDISHYRNENTSKLPHFSLFPILIPFSTRRVTGIDM